MKKTQLLTLVVLFSASSLAFASGEHEGGHGNQLSMPMGAHWMAPPAEAAITNPIKLSKISISTGEQLYQQNCISCHGSNADGKGMAGMMLNPKPANLRTMSGRHPDGDFAYKIREGRGAMPAWKHTLNEQQIWHLVNFIQTLNRNPIANTEPEHGHTDDHSHGS